MIIIDKESLLFVHKKEKVKTEFKCRYCPEKFSSQNARRAHYSTHPGEKYMFSCIFCGVKKPSEIRLNLHEKECYKAKMESAKAWKTWIYMNIYNGNFLVRIQLMKTIKLPIIGPMQWLSSLVTPRLKWSWDLTSVIDNRQWCRAIPDLRPSRRRWRRIMIFCGLSDACILST